MHLKLHDQHHISSNTSQLEMHYFRVTLRTLASSLVSPIFFNARERKEGEPGKRSHVKRVIND